MYIWWKFQIIYVLSPYVFITISAEDVLLSGEQKLFVCKLPESFSLFVQVRVAHTLVYYPVTVVVHLPDIDGGWNVVHIAGFQLPEAYFFLSFYFNVLMA